MNPGWSLAPVNQITTKGSRAWGENLSAGSYSPETPGDAHRQKAQQTLLLLQIYIKQSIQGKSHI